MFRYVTWTLLGAAAAVFLGAWVDLFQLGDPQAWIAAMIGGVLGFVAYGGPVEGSIVNHRKPERTSGALSFARLTSTQSTTQLD